MSQNLDGNPGTVVMNGPPFSADLFPGDTTENAATVGASAMKHRRRNRAENLREGRAMKSP
jgi:hypothetical protein